MPTYEFVTVDVFTDTRFRGNPLAVFPDAGGLEAGAMQALAREFNLSETAFVLPPEDPRHTARVRIFTPHQELPFAGHPNVGTGYVLAGRGAGAGTDHLVFEEPAGLVRVHPTRDAAGAVTGAAVSAPQSLQIGDEIEEDLLVAGFGLHARDLAQHGHRPLVASVGTPFVFAELTDLAALGRATPDLAALRRAAQHVPAAGGGVMLYVRQDGDATRLRARMFAPLRGIPEDPATGSAAAALAALLTAFAPGEDVDLTYEIEQGVEMGRPSRILGHARKTAEGPVSARIAGDCVPMLRGSVAL